VHHGDFSVSRQEVFRLLASGRCSGGAGRKVAFY
jgi:hypothetical protein